MFHALYFKRNAYGNWTISYKSKFVKSDTFKLETQRNKMVFLPTLEGNSLAVLVANFSTW